MWGCTVKPVVGDTLYAMQPQVSPTSGYAHTRAAPGAAPGGDICMSHLGLTHEWPATAPSAARARFARGASVASGVASLAARAPAVHPRPASGEGSGGKGGGGGRQRGWRLRHWRRRRGRRGRRGQRGRAARGKTTAATAATVAVTVAVAVGTTTRAVWAAVRSAAIAKLRFKERGHAWRQKRRRPIRAARRASAVEGDGCARVGLTLELLSVYQ